MSLKNDNSIVLFVDEDDPQFEHLLNQKFHQLLYNDDLTDDQEEILVEEIKTAFNMPEENLNLTPEQKIAIKNLWKAGIRLCHPDLVKESDKVDAQAYFTRLQTAYEENDLPLVRLLVNDLKRDNTFKLNPTIK